MRKIWNSERLYDIKFSFDEKCTRLFNITKEYFKTKKKNPIIFVGGGVLLLILILAISFSYANLNPVNSVEIFSENVNFENKDMGSWKVTKSAKWIEEDIANINFKIESNLGVGNIYTPSDYIFVFEDSAKMAAIGQDNINILYQFLSEMLALIIDLNENNRISVITFNSSYNIVTDFTRNLDPSQLTFSVSGNTNYYQALNGVNELLSNYTKEEGKDCKVIFITAGSPNEETPKEVDYSKMLKKKYSFLKINGIASFYPDSENKNPLYNISDNAFIIPQTPSETDLINTLVGAAGVNNFLSFKIEDTINSEYFDIVEATSDIGEVTIDSSLENEKVIWDLQDKYYSNTIEELDIKVRLKDEYRSSDDLLMFQTNIQEKITSLIYDLDENQISEEVISSLTPVLSTNYAVIYDNNEPDTCTVNLVPETKRYKPFTTVEISEETPTCSGYLFKGWKVVEEDVEQIGNDYFIMPSHDVKLKAEWSKVSIKKSMNSRVVEEGTLYAMMAANSVPDNIASEFVTSPTGIDFTQTSSDTNGKGIYQMASTSRDDRPIYYYRGAVDNNNVKFANFCWKIVRTTDTGGVKLIYNGPPDEAGGCTNTTGDITTIGQSYFFDINSSSALSLASSGYMYGNKYVPTFPSFTINQNDWVKYLGVSTTNTSITGTYLVGDDVSYDSATGLYTLIDYESKEFSFYFNSNNYVTSSRGYVCADFRSTTCSSVILILAYNATNSYITTTYSGGEKLPVPYSQIDTLTYKRAKNVEYINGSYYLVDLAEVPLRKIISSSIDEIEYPYTCDSVSSSCSVVKYNLGGLDYTFSEGENRVEVIDYLTSNSPNDNDSALKQVIDNWYSSNLVNYTTYLEDTIWCNDRDFYGYRSLPELLGTDDKLVTFKNSNRLLEGVPNLSCLLGDSFSVEPLYNGNVQIGNGKLTYPIATLTTDEVVLAGESYNKNTAGYLYNGLTWNLLTPFTYALLTANYLVNDGQLSYLDINSDTLPYVRPSVSLKPGTKSSSGDGTPTNPFVIE